MPIARFLHQNRGKSSKRYISVQFNTVQLIVALNMSGSLKSRDIFNQFKHFEFSPFFLERIGRQGPAGILTLDCSVERYLFLAQILCDQMLK